MHRAGAALADAASEFCSGEAEMLTDDPEQGRICGRIDMHLLSVENETRHLLILAGPTTWAIHAGAWMVASKRLELSDVRTCRGMRLRVAGALAEIRYRIGSEQT